MTGSDLLERLKALFLRDRAERELDEELRYHLEREAEARARSGSPLPNATRASRWAGSSR